MSRVATRSSAPGGRSSRSGYAPVGRTELAVTLDIEPGEEELAGRHVPLHEQRLAAVVEANVGAPPDVEEAWRDRQLEIDLEDALDGRHAAPVARVHRDLAAPRHA